MRDSLKIPYRRKATPAIRIAIAFAGSAVLSTWVRLPVLIPTLPWAQTDTGLIGQFEALSPELSLSLEFLVFAAAFFGLQAAVSRFDLSRLRLARPLLGIVASVVLVACLASLVGSLRLRAELVPVSLAALWVTASFGLGAGLVTVAVSGALAAMSGAPGILAAPLLVRAVSLVLFFRGGLRASDGLRAGIYAGLLSALGAVSLLLGSGAELRELGIGAVWAISGGLIEGLLYLFTKGMGERIMGHVSRERLVALLDLSQPLLQRMVHRAPGSFEHSRAMANLAEQAASSIGADALLTRVGAYYHDLGKSVDPKFFVENLEAGERSAHEGLSPSVSAAHILRHVTDGVAILREAGIPEAVVEFAYTHHGSQKIEYFLNKQRQLLGANEEIDLALFRYPGMKPGTKETAILMVVDSIEAASRTLDSPDRDRLDDMVRRIVFSKLAGEQLDESGLSMKELRIVCARVAETLVHMNHHRIKYPWQDERAKQFGLGERELSPPTSEVASYPRAVKGTSS